MYKIISLCLLILAPVYGQNHYIDDCLAPGTTPTSIYNQEVSKSGVFWQYVEETLRIPESGFAKSKITCISVVNLDSDENGGYPSIIAGGVGDLYVTLYFKSQLSKGFDFKVGVYIDTAITAIPI